MIEQLVNRFLCWPLPESVCSDPCVTVKGAPHRSGTSLLTADEARQLMEYLFSDEIARLKHKAETYRKIIEGTIALLHDMHPIKQALKDELNDVGARKFWLATSRCTGLAKIYFSQEEYHENVQPNDNIISGLVFDKAFDQLKAQLEETKSQVAMYHYPKQHLASKITQLKRENEDLGAALRSVTTDIERYSDANWVVQWVLDRNEKAKQILSKIGGRNERKSKATPQATEETKY